MAATSNSSQPSECVSPTPLRAFGRYPRLLYRVFDQEQYARAFVERGCIRLRLLDDFVAIEDARRRDVAEGRVHIQIPGPVTTVRVDVATGRIVGESTAPGVLNYQGEIVNPVYISCFSYPPRGDVRKLPRHFGRYAVVVHDPRRLAQGITDWLTAEGALGARPVVQCARVSYDKGTTRAASHIGRSAAASDSGGTSHRSPRGSPRSTSTGSS